MGKKIYFAFSLLLASFSGFASHFLGMDIRYVYTGTGNVYRVNLDVYGECGNGVAAMYSNEAISFNSTSCGANFTRSFLLQATDTLRSMYCFGLPVYCGSTYSPFLVSHYSDTVTLAPCTDWKISCTDGSRSAQILNIGSGTGTSGNYNIYVEAFLNNSAAPNSSPILDDVPHWIVGSGSIVTQPFHVTDIEGDSLTGIMMQPYTTASSAVPYYTSGGYSFAQPFGTGTFAQLSIPNSYLKTYASNIGRYALATRVYDYRYGVMVGYSSRDWAQVISVAGNPKAPVPATGSTFSTTTCPGQTNSFTVHFVDSVSTDSVYLTLTPPNNGITYTTTYYDYPMKTRT